jgi:hypothetical protein
VSPEDKDVQLAHLSYQLRRRGLTSSPRIAVERKEMINIDVAVLQTVPELAAASPGLRPRTTCRITRKTCWAATCENTYVLI